jgi:hypothetical protein
LLEQTFARASSSKTFARALSLQYSVTSIDSKNLFLSKINLNLIAVIVFNLINEFHANQIKFGVDTPRTKSKNFGRNS